MPVPLVLFALALITGILLGQAFLFVPWSTAVLFLALLAAGILRTRTTGRPLRLAMTASCAALLGCLLLTFSALHVPADHYSRTIEQEGSVREVSGRIASPLDRSGDRVAFLVDVASIDGRSASGDLSVTVRDDLPAYGRGDRVRMTGKISPPRSSRNPGGFDYRAYLARRSIHAVMAVRKGADVVIESTGTGPLRRIDDIRERIRQAFLRSTHGDASAVLRAMVLGDNSGLSEDLRQRFMNAGVTHILSISGSHLGLVAVLCFWTLRNVLFLLPERTYHRITLSMDPRKAAALATVVPVAFYTLLAGAEVATVRSLIMITAGMAALVLDRGHHLLSTLALAALISLVPDPQALFDISFQLSYLSVAAILFVVNTGNIIKQPSGDWRPRLVHSGAMLLAISAATALITGPLVALYFHQISLIGIVSNLVVVPYAGAVVVPLGLLAGLCSLVTGTIPLAGLVQGATDVFLSLVAFFAGLPGAIVHLRAPGILFLLSYAVLILSGAVLLRARLLQTYRPLDAPRRTLRSAAVALMFSSVLLITLLIAPLFRSRLTRLTFLDVGQGDCAILETAGGRSVLIDGGGSRENRFDPGLRIAAPYLWGRGIGTIDLAVLSHPHPDHMNGLASLLRTFTVREVWSSGRDTDLEGYGNFAGAVRERHIPSRTVGAGDMVRLGDTLIEVLHPPRTFTQRSRKPYAAENDRSLVLRIRTGGATYLFPGDVHGEGERALLGSNDDLTAAVVKVPHHGSRTSSSRDFVDAVRPSAAVISVGAGNPYRHPSEETVLRYEDKGARVYRTDRDGAVIVEETAQGLTFRTGAELALERIDRRAFGTWGMMERRNWTRLWVREWEI